MKKQTFFEFLKEKANLLDQKAAFLNDGFFHLSQLQSSKPSGLLYLLGNNIKKNNFPPTTKNRNELTVALNSFCKLFASGIPYTAICLSKKRLYFALPNNRPIQIKEILKATNNLINSDLSATSCLPFVSEFYKVLDQNENLFVRSILEKKFHESKGKTNIYKLAAEDF